MIKTISLLSVLLLGISLVGLAADKPDKPAKPRKGKLQHVVSFKFKETATPAQIDALVQAFGALPKKIKEIKGYEWGTNVSPEKHDKGFTHGFILTFKTAEDRDAYLVHPAHKEFGQMVGPVVADVFVIDFWAEK